MATMIEVLMVLDDIDKTKIVPMKNGKKGYRATFVINDEVDKFGNNVSGWAKQSQEERKDNMQRQYFANGTSFWSNGKSFVVNKENPKGKVVGGAAPVVENTPEAFTEVNDNLPF